MITNVISTSQRYSWKVELYNNFVKMVELFLLTVT